MSDECSYERARHRALEWWRSTVTDTDEIDDEAREILAAEYAAYVEELPPLRFPDSPPLSPAEYADENTSLKRRT